MEDALLNCWEIKQCGRQKGGDKVSELGECVVSRQALGHSCWAVAGTLCGGVVQGTAAQKEMNCLSCDVYGLYNHSFGQFASAVVAECPEEQGRYSTMMRERISHPKP